jgi:hypothetical protein
MARRVGVWIDHARAVLVWVDDSQLWVEHIESGVERKRRLAGGSRSRTPWGPQDVACDNRMGERHRQQVRTFLDWVAERIAGAHRVVVLGRGMLKLELAKRIRRSRELGAKLVDVISTDRMTDPQIVAKVQDFWGLSPERRRCRPLPGYEEDRRSNTRSSPDA